LILIPCEEFYIKTVYKSFFRLTLVFSLVVLLIFVFCLQKRGESAEQRGSEEKVNLAKYEKDFMAHLEELFSELRAHFMDGEFKEMADLLVDRTVLYMPTGERITTEGELLKFFMDRKKPDVFDLRFTLEYSKVFMVAEPIQKGEETIDAIGHSIITYHIIEKKKGEAITNTTGSAEYDAPHPKKCVWGKNPI
jgi:hypothetical protein